MTPIEGSKKINEKKIKNIYNFEITNQYSHPSMLVIQLLLDKQDVVKQIYYSIF